MGDTETNRSRVSETAGAHGYGYKPLLARQTGLQISESSQQGHELEGSWTFLRRHWPRGREGAPAGFHGPFERICLRGVGQGDLAPTGPPFAAPSFFCQGRAAGPRFHFPNAENLVTFAPFALGPFPASSRALRDAGDELDRGSRRVRCNAQRSWNWEQESGLVSVASKARANAFAPLRRAG